MLKTTTKKCEFCVIKREEEEKEADWIDNDDDDDGDDDADDDQDEEDVQDLDLDELEDAVRRRCDRWTWGGWILMRAARQWRAFIHLHFNADWSWAGLRFET